MVAQAKNYSPLPLLQGERHFSNPHLKSMINGEISNELTFEEDRSKPPNHRKLLFSKLFLTVCIFYEVSSSNSTLRIFAGLSL